MNPNICRGRFIGPRLLFWCLRQIVNVHYFRSITSDSWHKKLSNRQCKTWTSQYRHNHELFSHIIVTNHLSAYNVVSHTSFCYTPIDQIRHESGLIFSVMKNHKYLLLLSKLLNRKRTMRGYRIISDFIDSFVCIMMFNTIIRPAVGADSSRPSPIYRPSLDFLLSSWKS